MYVMSKRFITTFESKYGYSKTEVFQRLHKNGFDIYLLDWYNMCCDRHSYIPKAKALALHELMNSSIQFLILTYKLLDNKSTLE